MSRTETDSMGPIEVPDDALYGAQTQRSLENFKIGVTSLIASLAATLHVPDFVVNSGALIRGTIFHLEGRREPVEAIGRRIEGVVSDLLDAARELDEPSARVAIQEAERRVSRWRADVEQRD